MTSEELREKANGLRRAVQYGVENGKKNIIADLDVLTALFRGEIPVGGNEFAPEDVNERLYAVKAQRDKLMWKLSSIVDIAENDLRRGVLSGGENMRQIEAIGRTILDEIRGPLAELPKKDREAIAKSQRNDEAWMHAACLAIAETGQRWGENVKPSPAMEAVYNLRLHRDAYSDAAHEAKAALYGCREVLGSVANIQHAIDLLITAINFPTNPPSVVSGFDSRELTPTEHTEERIKNATEGAVDAYDE